MAKLITKFKYLKPQKYSLPGNYAKYIATREGVEKIDDTHKLRPSTKRQQDIINHIIKDFPNTKVMLEYEDYKSNSTIGNASEFITRALEDNADEAIQNKTYADYIATRPRVEKFGTHGLFTDDGELVNLADVSKELNQHQGNVWTAVISLRREDAERLGYSNGERWRNMLRGHAEIISNNLKIPMNSFKWYAAFHNESHHPHVHMIMYSTNRYKGYLTKQGLMNIRSSLANEIFGQDSYNVFVEQTEHRDNLKAHSREMIAEIISKINTGAYDNPKLENMLVELANALSNLKGKKVYGYLKPNIKAMVNNIVSELAKDERIAELYNLWYSLKEETIRTYTNELPDRIPLVDNIEFKSIKNMIIQEALNITTSEVYVDESKSSDEHEYDTSVTKNVAANKNWSTATAIIRLLHHLGRLIQDRADPSSNNKIDRKLRRQIDDKKQAHGIRQ